MKIPRHTRSIEEDSLPMKKKLAFKIAPGLSQRTHPSTSPKRSSTAHSSSVPSNIQSIANTMKSRMEMAVKLMVWKNSNNRAFLSSLVSQTANKTNSPFNMQQQQQQQQQTDRETSNLSPGTLTNHTLRKQHPSFVETETGVFVELDSSSTTSIPMPSLDYQVHPLTSSGGALTQSMVYKPLSKMTESHKQNDANREQLSRRRSSSSSGGTTSKMEIDEHKTNSMRQIKKPRRLSLKQQQKQQYRSRTNSAKTFINHSKKMKNAAAISPDIRCICDTPHEDFGFMVQCDDCLYWLHLSCLGLDEDNLDDTYRCPSCSVALDMDSGHHVPNSITTYRLDAQQKSKKMASRHGNPTQKFNNTRKRHLDPLSHSKSNRQKKRRIKHQLLHSTYDDRYDENLYSMTSGRIDDGCNQQQQERVIPTMNIDPSIKTTKTTPTGNVLVHVLGNRSAIINDPMNEDNQFDSDTTESDYELSDSYQHEVQQYQYYHRGSVSSSSSVPSLVSSPCFTGNDLDNASDERYGNDEFYTLGTTRPDSSILSTTASSECLDEESLFWISRLSYLEALQSSSEQQYFTPHASDVFLGGHQQEPQHQTYPLVMETPTTIEDNHYNTQLAATPVIISSPRAELPSTICSQDLSQFHFDSGPFWGPDPCTFN